MAATARRAIQFRPCYDLLASAKQILFQFSSICILCPGNQESAGTCATAPGLAVPNCQWLQLTVRVDNQSGSSRTKTHPRIRDRTYED
jgi:hypothetical protein